MAITKSRLQELIDEGATIYYVKYRNASVYIKPLKLEKDYKAEFIYRNLMLDEKDLYEHKADAEWDLEFEKGKVTRTEELNIPNYNEFERLIGITFYKKDVEYILSKYARGYEPTRISLSTFYWDDILGDFTSEELFDKPHNEENYKEACRLIKKLFMGEE